MLELNTFSISARCSRTGMLGVAVLKLEMLKTLLALRTQLAYLEGERNPEFAELLRVGGRNEGLARR